MPMDTLARIQKSIFEQEVAPSSTFSPSHLHALVTLSTKNDDSEIGFVLPSFSLDRKENILGGIVLTGKNHCNRSIKLSYRSSDRTTNVTFHQGSHNLTSYIGGVVSFNAAWIKQMADGFWDNRTNSYNNDEMYAFFLGCLCQSFAFNVYDLVLKEDVTLSEFLSPAWKYIPSTQTNNVDIVVGYGVSNKVKDMSGGGLEKSHRGSLVVDELSMGEREYDFDRRVFPRYKIIPKEFSIE